MPSHFKRVTLSGVDESTPLDFMEELSKEFPFIEWAFPYFATESGAARKASQEWLNACFSHPAKFSTAIHLHESQSFEELLLNDLPPHLLRANRLQLNTNAQGKDFNDSQLLDIYKKALSLGRPIVLPRHEYTLHAVDDFVGQISRQELSQVCVLADYSHGKGNHSDGWPFPEALQDKGVEMAFACRMERELMDRTIPKLETLGSLYALDLKSNLKPYNFAMKRAAWLTLEVCQTWLRTH